MHMPDSDADHQPSQTEPYYGEIGQSSMGRTCHVVKEECQYNYLKLCELAMFTVVKVRSVEHNKLVQAKLAFLIGDEVHQPATLNSAMLK